MNALLRKIRQCTVCVESLELGPRPVLQAHLQSRIAIIGQAPGTVVHRSGIPWDDKSGQNLRAWMGVSDTTFYDETKIALIPMGFCYPGKGKSGDLPPRSECAPLWHTELFQKLKHLDLILLIGKYAQNYYLEAPEKTLTDTVKKYEKYLPRHFVLPHPSPRNNIWQSKNTWFKSDVLPALKEKVASILSPSAK